MSLASPSRQCSRLRVAAALVLASALLAPGRSSAQVLGVHGLYAPATDGRRESFGAGGDFGFVATLASVGVWTALGVEYQRERSLGPGRGRVSADLRLVPPGMGRWIVPYVGASASANRSGGRQSEWSGTRLGVDGLAGVVIIPDFRRSLGLSVEERWGYVRAREHAFATRVGLRVGFY